MAFLDNEQNDKRYNNESGLILAMTLNELYRYIRYMVADSPLITDKNRRNLRKLLSSINMEASFPEENMTGRFTFRFLKLFTEMMLDESFGDEPSIRDYFMNNIADKGNDGIPTPIIEECLDQIHNQLHYPEYRFSESEVRIMNQYVEDRIKYSYLIKHSQAMKELAERISYGTESLRVLNDDTKTLVEGIYRNMRDTDTSNQALLNELDFSDEDNSEEIIRKEINSIKSPSNRLRTGYRLFNASTGGGFEGGRTYYFFAPPKSFKSGTLLNMACTVCANNPEVINFVEPNLTPVVVYLTMENTLRETLERLFEYVTGTSLKDTKMSSKEVMRVINEKLSSKTGIRLVVKYAPSHSESTEYLYDIVEDLKRKGRKVIMMVQDYIGRINSANPGKVDLRITLGDISDQFSTFAKHYNIPLVTAGQLNRYGVERKENMQSTSTPDIASQLSSSFIAESLMILNNLDFAFIISKENHILQDGSEQEVSFNGFHLVAQRGKSDNGQNITYFAQPFSNGFRMAEDIETDKTLGTYSIARTLYGNQAVDSNIQQSMQPSRPSMGSMTVGGSPSSLPIGTNGSFKSANIFTKEAQQNKNSIPNPMDSIL